MSKEDNVLDDDDKTDNPVEISDSVGAIHQDDINMIDRDEINIFYAQEDSNEGIEQSLKA